MTKTVDITEELKNKIYGFLAQNSPRYDNGVVIDVEHNYYVSSFLEKIKNMQLYAERIKEFEEKTKCRESAITILKNFKQEVALARIDEVLQQFCNTTLQNLGLEKTTTDEIIKGLEGQVQIYKKATTLLQEWVIDSFKDNIESSKARYERDKNIYNSHNYIELPVFLLGYKSNDKVVYSLYYSNINSLENNKKYLFSKIKDNDYLRNEYIKLYFPNIQDWNLQEWSVEHQEQYINEVCKEDMYFETFLNSKDRINFVKENTEITHLAISCKNSRVQTEENTYIVFGNFKEKEVLKRNILTNNNEKILEILNS